MTAITATELRKTFVLRSKAGRLRRDRTEVEAVAGIDLVVEPGEMVGYIGPNGAGKSTTIKMLTGILTPTSGSARVLGLNPVADRMDLAKRIGVVFGQRTQLWWDLPLVDSFELLHAVYRTDPTRHRANLDKYVDLLDLGPQLSTPVRQLSLGQRMRGELTAALLHDPELVFLDEPTIGLDVVSKHAVRSFLTELNVSNGTTVILTTHDMADIEHLCERIVIIDHGQLMVDGSLAAFKEEHGRDRIVVVDLVEAGVPLQVPHASVERVVGNRQWIRFDRTQTTAADVISSVVSQQQIVDVTVEEPAIEELVRSLYQGGIGS